MADGTPRELQNATGMHILEVVADDPYAAQVVIQQRQEVASVTQLGIRLRILIPQSYEQPLALVNDALAGANIKADVTATSATLEDVFVAVTMKAGQQQ